MLNYFLLAIFILLQCLDGYTTCRALQNPQNYEKNPLMRWLMSKLGMKRALIMTKLLVILWLSALTFHGGVSWWPYALGVLNIWYLWVVVHNFRKLLSQ